MSEILGLEHLSLRPDGPTLTLSVSAGQSLSIVGPAGSGKSALLRVLSGMERPAQGAIHLRGRVAIAGAGSPARRTKVQSLARKSNSEISTQKAADVLSATRLWDVRQLSVGDLSPSQLCACEMIEPLVSDSEIAFFDGHLDALDPWTLPSVVAMIRHQMAGGRTFVISTHRPDLIREFESLIVLNEFQVKFAGTVDDLLRAGPPHTIEVSTENDIGVRALVSPFQVRAQKLQGGMRFEAPEGQELAARLLLEGYGDIKFVVVRPPTIEEALRTVL